MPSAASRSAAPSAVPSAPAYRQADRTAERAARGRSAQRRLTVIVSPAQASMENRPYTVMMSWYSPMPSIPMRSESTMRYIIPIPRRKKEDIVSSKTPWIALFRFMATPSLRHVYAAAPEKQHVCPRMSGHTPRIHNAGFSFKTTSLKNCVFGISGLTFFAGLAIIIPFCETVFIEPPPTAPPTCNRQAAGTFFCARSFKGRNGVL